MQPMLALSLATVILTAATLITVIILAIRKKLPDNFQQLPDVFFEIYFQPRYVR